MHFAKIWQCVTKPKIMMERAGKKIYAIFWHNATIFLQRNNCVMTESLLNEHFPDLFWRIYLAQKHSETVPGTIEFQGTCDGFPIKMLQVYLKSSYIYPIK